MVQKFLERIEISLQDENLQSALDANAAKRIKVRTEAFARIPDHQQRRQRAHAVRADVVAHLDQYLEQFIQKVQANGIVVHRAADAREAVKIILELARQRDARLLAKSKTMVSEEIDLNHALEEAGLQVVETDLGEYIVQLRGEKPSHIITPAVHLRRAQVGETFHEKLGIPLTDDVSVMTEAARLTLRDIFLRADIGLSGVNFGVVETGTLCVCTNEGNGRMVTTVPKTHIALMGIERMVPTLDDLALMLSLLPRSSTGQQLTSYVSLLKNPRRPDEPDGPLERHLVLVDNGRRLLSQSPLAEALFCIRCGACLNTCPVFREIGGHAYVNRQGEISAYPGPIGSIVSAGLFGQAEYGHLARASSLCGACKEACPVDIDLPGLLLRVRAGGVRLYERSAPLQVPGYLRIGLRGFNWIATAPWRFHLAQKMAGIFSRLAAPFSNWIRMPAFTGWGLSKDFPRPVVRSFRERFKSHQPVAAGENLPRGGVQAGKDLLQPEPAPQQAQEEIELAVDFQKGLEELGGHFIRCRQSDLAGKVLELLQAYDARQVLAWEPAQLPAGLADELQAQNIQFLYQPDAKVRVGITGALAGISETATVVLPAGAGRMLSASLLPEVHIALLPVGAIYATLGPLLRHPEIQGPSSTVLVSGPSRTGDIEMTLTVGVHGPKEIYVFCFEP